MRLITKELLDDYLKDDRVNELMDRLSQDADEGLTCQRWLRDSAPKRLVFELLYGDLLKPNIPRQPVLDVGGGGLRALHDNWPNGIHTNWLTYWHMTTHLVASR